MLSTSVDKTELLLNSGVMKKLFFRKVFFSLSGVNERSRDTSNLQGKIFHGAKLGLDKGRCLHVEIPIRSRINNTPIKEMLLYEKNISPVISQEKGHTDSVRMSTKNGRLVIKRRRAKGRNGSRFRSLQIKQQR